VAICHLPEFTMLEWYRANAGYDAVMADTIVVIAHAAQATGIGHFAFRGRRCDPFAEPELLTVASAFERFCRDRPTRDDDGGEGDRTALAAVTRARVRIARRQPGRTSSARCWVEHIEAEFGQDT